VIAFWPSSVVIHYISLFSVRFPSLFKSGPAYTKLMLLNLVMFVFPGSNQGLLWMHVSLHGLRCT